MKTALLLLLCAINGAVAVPQGESYLSHQIKTGGEDFEFGYDLDVDDDLNRPNMAQLRQGFDQIGASLAKALAPALNLAENIPFIRALKTIIAEQLSFAGTATEGVVAKLVISSSALAVPKIFDEETRQNILVTFKVVQNEAASPLTSFDGVKFGGDAYAAQQFAAQLNLLLEAAQSGHYTQLQVMANLEMQLLDVLATNAIVKNKGALALKNLFNLETIINAVTHPLQTVESMVNSLAECQKFIPSAMKKFSTFANTVKEQANAFAKDAGQISEKIAGNLLKGTLDYLVSYDVLNKGNAGRLLATFAPNMGSNSAPLKSKEEVDLIQVGRDSSAAAEFKSTIAALVELKEQNKNSIVLLAAVEVAAVDLLAANTMVKLSALSPILHYLGLSEMGSFIKLAANVVAKSKDRILNAVELADNFATDIQQFVSQTVNAGGKLTTDALSFSLDKVLNVAVNNKLKSLFSDDVANKLKATFGNAQGEPLTVEAVDSLQINSKDEQTKQIFVNTLKALVEMPLASQEAKIAALAGLNVAIIDLLTANSIMEVKAALALKELLAS